MTASRSIPWNCRPVVLASASRTRREMLEKAGLEVEIRPADIDEPALRRQLADRTPAEIALALAEAKARKIACHDASVTDDSKAFVIGADQVLSLGDRILAKPRDRQSAIGQLRLLSGRDHLLTSAVVVHRGEECLWRYRASARLVVRDLTDRFIERYLDRVGQDVLESVGCYRIEGEGIHLFSSIEGDFFTIRGLPLVPLLEALRRLGAMIG